MCRISYCLALPQWSQSVSIVSTVCRVDRTKYQIQIPLPPKIDASVTMMTVEEKPDVTYSDIGGCKEQIDKMREVVELPMLHPEKFVALGIDPPKGVLCYGPPGTGQICTHSSWAHTYTTHRHHAYFCLQWKQALCPQQLHGP